MKFNFFKNITSNYLNIGIITILSIFSVKLLYTNLSHQDYGFWGMLWTIFGYSLLLDFGFGKALQKKSTECLKLDDIHTLNRSASSIFVVYSLMAAGLMVLTFVASFFLSFFFRFSPGTDLIVYQKMFILFGFGALMTFPIGFFGEILAGIHRYYVQSLIDLSVRILNFLAIVLCLHFNFDLPGIILSTLGLAFLSNGTMYMMIKRFIPGFHISLRFFDYKVLKDLLGFSLHAYLITTSNLIILRTDQIVIASVISISAAAGYQIVLRLSTMFHQIAHQMVKVLSPVSNHIFMSKDIDALRNLFCLSSRFACGIAFLMYTLLIFFLAPLLRIWVGLEDVAVLRSGYILLTSMLVMMTFRNPNTEIFLICEKHKVMSKVIVIEAVSNLILSVVLAVVFKLGIVGVALGTFIPNLLIAVVFNIPYSLLFFNLNIKDYFVQIFSRNLVPMIGLVYVTRMMSAWADSFPKLMLSFVILTTVYLFLQFLFLEKTYKDIVFEKLKILFKQGL